MGRKAAPSLHSYGLNEVCTVTILMKIGAAFSERTLPDPAATTAPPTKEGPSAHKADLPNRPLLTVSAHSRQPDRKDFVDVGGSVAARCQTATEDVNPVAHGCGPEAVAWCGQGGQRTPAIHGGVVDPALGEHFLARHPLLAADHIQPAGVRFGSDVPQDMVAVRIGPPQRYAVVGAPDYFRRKPPPRSPRELSGHECILRRFPSGAMQQWEFQRRAAKVQLPAPRIVVNDAQIAATAALEGGGLAYLHEKYVERELAAGELVRVLEAWSPGIGPPYLYYARQRYLPAVLRAFIDFARDDARAGR